ncbi:response regulator [Bacillus horti]|uniref:Two-component system response regulator YesN n=1 Tax=Caldalkalibacillus horti TaxID=77523 RepID=A0ABT9W571_9BACI|nr:response regulator [Bacillus horti]MDQ0168385.1 two-component system response regulator YesN [Bacillus horti]
MLKVVIVDDEYMIREGLRTMVPWEELGMEVRGAAANGIAGLELIKQEMPDILLTDIRMPGFTGLELMTKALKLLPDLKSIILTGYGEFNYAQEALKIGALDFILKPTDEAELISILQKAKAQIENEKQKDLSLVRLHCYQYMTQNGMDLPEPIKEYFTGKGKLLVFSVGLLQSADQELMDNFFSTCSKQLFYIGEIENRKYFILHSFQEIGSVEAFERIINKELFNHEGSNQNDVSFAIGVSTIVEELSQLPIVYTQAKIALEQQLLSHQGGTLFYSGLGHQAEIIEAIQFVDQHYTSHLTLSELSARFYMSDSYFSRLFKQHTGKNFVDYLTEKRVRKAKELLQGTSLKTYEIAQGVGYPDQRYFSQIFKKATGFTPSDYRQEFSDKGND